MVSMTPEEILQHKDHRPWPLPRSPWIMRQTWNDLLFAHWSLPAEQMRPLVPPELGLDLFDGKAWVAVTPFHMTDVAFRGMPPIPVLSAFPELNVRTYVTNQGKAGVFFFSLDAFNPPAVWGARLTYHLPYFYARMFVDIATGGEYGTREIRYSSLRFRAPRAEFKGTYGPTSPPATSKPGSVEHFLTERYRLYSVYQGGVYAADIHHLPWQLQTAEATITGNSMAAAAGIALPESKPLLHFSKRMDVLVWPIRRL
jgi:uncharacterized protein YqjF (DUF2071 family)